MLEELVFEEQKDLEGLHSENVYQTVLILQSQKQKACLSRPVLLDDC